MSGLTIRLAWMLMAAFISLPVACTKTTIKGTDRKRPAVVNPTFTLRNVTGASGQTSGQAELAINSASDLTVECTTCGSLTLNFSKSGASTGGGFVYTAPFSYPFVDRTYVCKANLKINFLAEKAVKEYLYAIYYCPEDPTTKVRNCDKTGATEKCGF